MRQKWQIPFNACLLALCIVFGACAAEAFDIGPGLDELVFPDHGEQDELKIAMNAGKKILHELVTKHPPPNDPDQVANAPDHQHARELGFVSADEAKGAELVSDYFIIYRVGLDQLAAFHDGVNPRTLLKFDRLLFPFTVRNPLGEPQTRSSLTLRQIKKTTWRPARWGSPILTMMLAQARKAVPLAAHNKGFVVWIPALNRYFFGYLHGAEFMIVPLVNDRLNFIAGDPTEAKVIFKKLLEEVRNTGDGPR